MKRLLCSLALGTAMLVGTSGAWAVPLIIVDTFDEPTQTVTHTGPGSSAFTMGSSPGTGHILGDTRTMQAGNTGGTDAPAGTADGNVDPGFAPGMLTFDTDVNSDGRLLLRYDANGAGLGKVDFLGAGATADLSTQVLRQVVPNQDVRLLASLTICGGSGATPACYTDEFEKPAPSDNNPIVPIPGAGGENRADHFLDNNAFPNFVDRAVLTTLGAGFSGLLHTGTFVPDDVGGNTTVDAAVRDALHNVTLVQLVLRVSPGGVPVQSIDNAINLTENCIEVLDRSSDGLACHTPLSEIPEPATLSLLGLGLVGLGLRTVLQRRARKA